MKMRTKMITKVMATFKDGRHFVKLIGELPPDRDKPRYTVSTNGGSFDTPNLESAIARFKQERIRMPVEIDYGPLGKYVHSAALKAIAS